MGGEENNQTAPLSLEQLVASLQRRDIPLPFEIGSFVVLEVSEAQRERSRLVSVADVRLSDAGEVLLADAAPAVDQAEASRSTIALLRRLLEAAEAETPPSLLELAERGPSAGWNLQSLHDELEALLVPLNRAAVRRVVARMVRDARRHGVQVGTPREPWGSEVGSRAPEVAAAGRAPAGDPVPASKGDLPASDAGEVAPERSEPVGLQHAPLPDAGQLDARFDALMDRLQRSRVDEAPGSKAAGSEAVDIPELEESSAGGSKRGRWLIGLLLLMVLLLVLLGLKHGQLFASRLDAGDIAPAPGVEGVRRDAASGAGKSPGLDGPGLGTLHITSDPSGAQVLQGLGRAPLVLEDLRVGVAEELVAIAGGRKPARVVIPPDADWRPADSGPHLELTLRTEPSTAGDSMPSLGATRLPHDLGHAGGRKGTATIRTQPPGARVYRLMGFTPNARIEGVSTDRPLHVLVHHPDRGVRALAIEPALWPRDAGSRRLEVHVGPSSWGDSP